jgi:membrane associated rhomboid family serine protease
MIPVRDSPRSRTFPYVNIAIIAANFAVFFYELVLQGMTAAPGMTELDRFVYDWGTTPACLNQVLGLDVEIPLRRLADYRFVCDGSDAQALMTLLTSMFMHAGWLHLLGNMLFLYVFGDNVEDNMGHISYLLFYLLMGLFGTLAHAFMNINHLTPSLGASGAIAGVMAAYVVLFPRASVGVVVPFMFLWIIPVPAWMLIGSWFFIQLVNGYAAIGAATTEAGGTAWFAHIGGFVAGLLLVWVFREYRGRPRRASPW